MGIEGMKKIILLLIVGLIGWQVYKYEQRSSGSGRAIAQEPWSPPERGVPAAASTATNFRCDGRTYCSQMTSCAEATFFLKNCPGTKMDGNNDGVPCEQQWCR